jgi:hypothetical protein
MTTLLSDLNMHTYFPLTFTLQNHRYQTHNHLKPELTYISHLKDYFLLHTRPLCIHYKDPPINALWGTIRRLLRESHEIYEMRSVFKDF